MILALLVASSATAAEPTWSMWDVPRPPTTVDRTAVQRSVAVRRGTGAAMTGLGAAALAGGLGGLAAGLHAEPALVRDYRTLSPTTYQSRLELARERYIIGGTVTVAGAVMLGVGIALLRQANTTPDTPPTDVWFGPNSVVVRHRF
jgi:hypothetical protein